MRQRQMGRRVAAAAALAIGLAAFVAAPGESAIAGRPAAALQEPRVEGPCAISKPAGEPIQVYSKELIRCATALWPLEGGAAKAICIARRESGLIPTASSATGLYVGLFQHEASAWEQRFRDWADPAWRLKDNPFNGRSNAIVTIRMVNAQGWGPWAGVGC